MDIQVQINEDPNYKRFLAVLEQEVKENWKGNLKGVYNEAGISKSYFSEIRNKKRKASFKTQAVIAKACGYTYESFLKYDKSPDSEPETIPEDTEMHNKYTACLEELLAATKEIKILTAKVTELENALAGRIPGPEFMSTGDLG